MQKAVRMRPATSDQRNLFLKILFTSSKIFLSGILAFIILTPICFVFNNRLNGDDSHAFWSQSREGFSWGVSDNMNYNNLHDFDSEKGTEILFMGSSFVEARQVFTKDTAASVLENLSGYEVYNIGVSGHFFNICAQNLEDAVKKYQPSKYIIIETFAASFSDREIYDMLNRTVPGARSSTKKTRGPLRLFFRKSNVLRYIYAKAKETFNKMFNQDIGNRLERPHLSNPVLLSKLLKQMKNTASIYGAKLIFAYHPTGEVFTSFDDNGKLKKLYDPDSIAQFSELCAQNGIYFLDVIDRFSKEYEKNYTLPYGFINTSVGSGHFNKYGNRFFAEEIYKLIQKVEAQTQL